MPDTYAVHLGNSNDLMEVAEDFVARRVLREHVRESLGVRKQDLIFAIINSMFLVDDKYTFLHYFVSVIKVLLCSYVLALSPLYHSPTYTRQIQVNISRTCEMILKTD